MAERRVVAAAVIACVGWLADRAEAQVPVAPQEEVPASEVACLGYRPYEEWLAEWTKATPEAREKMVRDLLFGAHPNAAAIRAAFGLLKEGDAERRALGCRLARWWDLYGVSEAEALAALEPMLDDATPRVRLEAARTLTGSRAQPRVLDTLIDLANDARASERLEAAGELVKRGRTEPRVVRLFATLLHDPDVRLRRRAVEGLAYAATSVAAARPFLREALADADEKVRLDAARSLVAVEEVDASVVAVLAKLATSSERRLRSMALRTVGMLGVEWSEAARPLLIAALHDGAATVRGEAIALLAGLADQGGDVSAALLPLVARLQDDAAEVRGAAAGALGHVGASSAVAVSALGALVQDADLAVRAQALASLVNAGEEVVLALPQLIAALEDPEADTRRAAANLIALGKARAAPAVAALAMRLADPVAAVRLSSCYALRRIGSASIAELPAVARTLAADPNPKVRIEAARLIAELEPLAEGVVEALIAATRDVDVEVRDWSLLALRKIAVRSHAVVAGLREAARRGDLRH